MSQQEIHSTECGTRTHYLHIFSRRFVSLQHAPDLAFHLLTTLMTHQLVTPDKDVWNLFIPSVSQPSQAALRFLASYLHQYDLPELFKPQYLANVIPDEGIDNKYPLRYLLLEWLLPQQEDTSDSFDVPTSSVPKSHGVVKPETISHVLLARILISLIRRDSRFQESNLIKAAPTDMTGRFTPIEDIYLVTNFDKDFADTDYRPAEVTGTRDVSVIHSLGQKLFELLARDCTQVTDITTQEVE